MAMAVGVLPNVFPTCYRFPKADSPKCFCPRKNAPLGASSFEMGLPKMVLSHLSQGSAALVPGVGPLVDPSLGSLSQGSGPWSVLWSASGLPFVPELDRLVGPSSPKFSFPRNNPLQSGLSNQQPQSSPFFEITLPRVVLSRQKPQSSAFSK